MTDFVVPDGIYLVNGLLYQTSAQVQSLLVSAQDNDTFYWANPSYVWIKLLPDMLERKMEVHVGIDVNLYPLTLQLV